MIHFFSGIVVESQYVFSSFHETVYHRKSLECSWNTPSILSIMKRTTSSSFYSNSLKYTERLLVSESLTVSTQDRDPKTGTLNSQKTVLE